MTIDQFNFAGKKAIVRVDFNVPLDENGNVTDDTRIRGALPTLKKILADGGAVIMMSHMGKPKGKVNPKDVYKRQPLRSLSLVTTLLISIGHSIAKVSSFHLIEASD